MVFLSYSLHKVYAIKYLYFHQMHTIHYLLLHKEHQDHEYRPNLERYVSPQVFL